MTSRTDDGCQGRRPEIVDPLKYFACSELTAASLGLGTNPALADGPEYLTDNPIYHRPRGGFIAGTGDGLAQGNAPRCFFRWK
jgi:hypothetical protein